MKTDAAVNSLCNTILRAVVNVLGDRLNGKDLDKVSDVLKAETKDFLFGDGYKAERECVLAGTVSQSVVIASVVSACVEKILNLQ